MRFEGKVSIRAPRERVWTFLTDPEAVSKCAPGLEKLETVEPGRKFRATTSVGFGSVRVRFVNDVEWVELDAPNLARMRAHGSAPGSGVDAETSMVLTDGPDGGTDLAWTADVNVVGTVASLAARLMGSMTRKLTSRFFRQVRRKIESKSPRPPR